MINVAAIPSLVKEIESLEFKHKLEPENGRIRPTIDFLSDLAAKLKTTITGAFMAWAVSTECYSRLAEREEESAEIASRFNVNPYELSVQRRLGLLALLPKVEARHVLMNGNFDPLDPKRVYNLVLLATGDQEQAIKARGDSIEALMEYRRIQREGH